MASKAATSAGAIATRWVLRIFLYFWILTILFPLYWMLATSLKGTQYFIAGDLWGWPSRIFIRNYIVAWVDMSFSRYVLNTLLVDVLTVALFVLMLTTTSYILGKYVCKITKIASAFYFFAMMIPGILLLVPLYTFVKDLGVPTDNLIVLAVVYAAQALPAPVFLLTGFVKSIDKSFIEAAWIDGANEWYIYSGIVLPFVRPVVLFMCLTQFMGTWNEYLTALTFLGTSDGKWTLSVGIQKLVAKYTYTNSGDYGVIFAGLVISIIPIVILYVLFQKQIQNGTDMSEGIK